MTGWLRVRDISGHEVTIPARLFKPGLIVLDKPALGPDGCPRPPKYRLPLGTPLPGGKVDRRRKAANPD